MQTNGTAKGYSNAATLGKAKSKVRCALLVSPTRKKTVLVAICNEMNNSDRNELINAIPSKSIKNRNIETNNSTRTDIGNFYERDDISRMSPKMKDVVKRKNVHTGADELTPKRHMILTVKEAYALFAEERKAANKGIKMQIALLSVM